MTYRWDGYCAVCEGNTVFSSINDWYRDNLSCESCGSIPRERATMLAINRICPDWRRLKIHESSPTFTRGPSARMRKECAGYVATYLFADVEKGQSKWEMQCEDLESQTFADNTFDLVVTQDIYEHLFDPAEVTREIFRTLRPGGFSILTTGIWKDRIETEVCATRDRDGTIKFLSEPEYHGDPLGNGALVTHRFGHDFIHDLSKWAPFDVEIWRFSDRNFGIMGEFTDVIICRKPGTV